MLVRPSVFALILAAGAVRADSPRDVADLVKQLGDPKFATREAAQKELLKRGEGIVPELDQLAKTADAETAERIRKVRYDVVGYKDDIRRLLLDFHEKLDSTPGPVSDELHGLIAGHQPGSGDLLVSILAQPDYPLYRQALRTFVATWDAATPAQIDRYIQQVVTLKTGRHRAKFPAKVAAMISFEAQIRDGWSGWPSISGDKKFDFRTRTTRYVDGKPYDKPFQYQYPFATVGWVKVGELTEGKHTISAVMEYEFTQRGEKRKGTIRSADSALEVVADTGDDLIAPRDEAVRKYVLRSFRTRELEYEPEKQEGPLVRQPLGNPWEPQVRWNVGGDKWAGIHVPIWEVWQGIDVDLCFDVEIHDVKTGKVYPSHPICVRRGERSRGYLYPSNSPEGFAKGRDGFVAVKVVFKPSRAVALNDPAVTRYFPETITTGEMRAKVYQVIPDSRFER